MQKETFLPKELSLPGLPYMHNTGLCSVVVDIPKGYVDIKKYNGTMGHKINHNFNNSIQYDYVRLPNLPQNEQNLLNLYFQVDSVRYGLVGIFTAIKDIKKGEQLFSNYGYAHVEEMVRHREWYYHEWQAFKTNPDNAERAEVLSKYFAEKMKSWKDSL